MARKGAKQSEGGSPRPLPSDLRYGTRPIEDIRAELDKIIHLADLIKGELKVAEKLGEKDLFLDGVKKGEQVLKILRRYQPNVAHAVEKLKAKAI